MRWWSLEPANVLFLPNKSSNSIHIIIYFIEIREKQRNFETRKNLRSLDAIASDVNSANSSSGLSRTSVLISFNLLKFRTQEAIANYPKFQIEMFLSII